MRLVLDTNVLVAAFRSPSGASARLMEAVEARRVELLASVPLFVEWEAVLTRPVHLAVIGRSAAEICEMLDELCVLAAPVDRAFSWRPQLKDPDDEMVLEAAVNGMADAIVTFEVGTFSAAATSFGIEVLTPGRVWARLKP